MARLIRFLAVQHLIGIVVYHNRRIRRMIFGAVNDAFVSRLMNSSSMVMRTTSFRLRRTEPSNCERRQQRANCKTVNLGYPGCLTSALPVC